ncbi:MAG: hypothetical protein IPI47_17600 [Piscinibacter sp.]|nr:hypothetical protein [Piscinibacter sp.]
MWIQAVYAPVKDEMGRVVKFVKIATDVTAEVVPPACCARPSNRPRQSPRPPWPATWRSASRWRASPGRSPSCAPASTSCWKPARSSSPTSAGSSARSPRAT